MDGKAAVSGVVALAVALAGCSSTKALRVGSKNFTEQLVLGEIVAQYLEAKQARPVERRLNLGGTLLAHQALEAGEIDLYPEYTGTALATVLKSDLATDPGVAFARCRQEYRQRMNLEWLEPLGFNNSFAMTVRGEDARAKNLRTLTEAAEAGPWRLGVGHEFQSRSDGFPILMKAYPLRQETAPRAMDLGLMFQALEQKSVDMIAANTTDGLLEGRDFVVLEDDKSVFPPYQAALVVRQDTLAANAGLAETLGQLSGKLDEAAMRRLNKAVDVDKKQPRDVAREWLVSSGLLPAK